MQPMTDGLWSTLGVAAPLVGILIYLLRQATIERQEITTKFLEALTTTVSANTQATREIGIALDIMRKASQSEHERIIDAVGKMGSREVRPSLEPKRRAAREKVGK